MEDNINIDVERCCTYGGKTYIFYLPPSCYGPTQYAIEIASDRVSYITVYATNLRCYLLMMTADFIDDIQVVKIVKRRHGSSFNSSCMLSWYNHDYTIILFWPCGKLLCNMKATRLG